MEAPVPQPPGKPSPAPERLKRRADFLNTAKGKRFYAKGFVLQAAPRRCGVARQQNTLEPSGAPIDLAQKAIAPRFGFTVTKKTGGAVLRNRIRRRLREALRLASPLPLGTSHDYVIVARPEAVGMPFLTLQAELIRAFGKIDAGGKPAKSRRGLRQDSHLDSGGEMRAAGAPCLGGGREGQEAGRDGHEAR